MVVTLKKCVTPNQDVNPKDVPSSTHVFNSYFVNEMKNSGTYKDYEKSRLIKHVYNDNDNIKFYLCDITQACVEIAPKIGQNFHIRPSYKLISLLVVSSDFIIKVIKRLHNVPEISIMLFAIYHPHYKEKLGIIESIIELVTNSAASLFAHNSDACAA